jgi:precorrin-6B methylase 1
MSNAKNKFNDLKTRFIQLLDERPLETIAAISAVALAAAKMIGAVNDSRNASSWKREVRRREQAQRGTIYKSRR